MVAWREGCGGALPSEPPLAGEWAITIARARARLRPVLVLHGHTPEGKSFLDDGAGSAASSAAAVLAVWRTHVKQSVLDALSVGAGRAVEDAIPVCR